MERPIKPIIFSLYSESLFNTKHIPEISSKEYVLKSTAFLYYHAFSRISYYMLLCPYRTELKAYVQAHGIKIYEVIIHTNRIQKGLCGICHIVTMMVVLIVMNMTVLNRSKPIHEEPSAFFDIFSNSMFFFALCVYLYIIWFRTKGMVHIFETCQKYIFIPDTNWPLYKETVIVSSMFLISSCLSWRSFYSKSEQYSDMREELGIGELHWALHFIYLAIFYIPLFYIAIFSHTVLMIFPDIACLSIINVGQQCHRYLRDNPNLTLSQVLCYLTPLKDFVMNLNDVTSLPLFMMVGNALINLTSAFLEIIDPGKVEVRIVGTIYSTAFVVILIAVADSTSKINSLAEYIYNKRNQEDFRNNMETLVVLSDLSSHPIGLQAFRFPISSGFVVTVLSTALTYTIILLQFKLSNKTNQQ